MARITSLDGLRGVAALTVLAHHSLLLFPVLAAPYYSDSPEAFGTGAWWLVHTPLHILWEGKAGVYVFFVLSGFVLTIPALNGRRYDWRAYYPSRLIRLYLPVWGAVLLAIGTFILVPRTADVFSPWLAERPRTVTMHAVIKDVTLVAGSGGLASPLWSLTWEVLFSLALPIAILVALKMPRAHVAIVIGSLVVVTVGGVLQETALMYPPMFMIGVILATRREDVSRIVSGMHRVGWTVVLVLASFLVCSRWLVMAFAAPAPIVGATVGPMLIGSIVFVVAAVEWVSAARFLDRAPFGVIGRWSFSLYLVHEPLVVAAGFTFPSQPGIAVLFGVGAAAIVTPIFYYAVERPSHRLAKIVGRLASRKVSAPALGSDGVAV